MRLIFRPIEQWPYPTLTTNRKPPPFSASWTSTQQILNTELTMLGVDHAVIQVAANERAMRIDGGLRADVRPDHPGVILSFESKHGPLSYATDQFDGGTRYVKGSSTHTPGWQANARAIALGLEALRKVDRYGISKGGEQYRGFTAIGSGAVAMPPGSMSELDALEVLRTGAGWAYGPDRDDPADIDRAYRDAAKRLHPDTGGSTEAFQRLQEAKAALS